MKCFCLNTFYSVLTFLYSYTVTNFYSHSHHFRYDYFRYYCFCYCRFHYFFFIFNLLSFIFLVFTTLFYLFIYRIFLNFKQMTKMDKTLLKVGIKDTEVVSVSLMETLSTVCLTSSSDDFLLKWHCYILSLTIISFIL